MSVVLKKAVIITFDRWHCGFLGCQGNPWVDTPELDQLAVRGTVFDQHFAENLSPTAHQHAWWTGRFQFPLDVECQRLEPSWLPWLAGQGVQSTLLHDPAARLPLDPKRFSTSRSVSLDDVAGLHFERDVPRFARAAISRIKQMAQSPGESELFWIHAGGLPINMPSLASEELYGGEPAEPIASVASQVSDEVETEDIEFPRLWRRKRSSPRELADARLHGTGWKTIGGIAAPGDWRHRRDLYSGQVTQWDAWVGRILDAVAELRKDAPVLLIFTAAAGEHLGEHAQLGSAPELFEERIHVPLIVEMPLDEPYSGRRRVLTQDVDLSATILDWFGMATPSGVTLDGHSLLPVIRDDQTLPRETVFIGDSNHAGVRTADYYYRRQLDPDGSEPHEMIFTKPDDHWDADDSLRQYIHHADELNQKWLEFVNVIRSRTSGSPA